MTRANSEQLKNVPWFAKAGAACSIIPIARFVSENIFALKGGGYGCFFRPTGVDEEGLTDQELESQLRMIEGSLRGLPEGAALYQYTLSRLLVEASILLAASRGNATAILKDAATAYKVNTEAIATKVRQEFSAKVKAKRAAQPAVKVAKKAA